MTGVLVSYSSRSKLVTNADADRVAYPGRHWSLACFLLLPLGFPWAYTTLSSTGTAH